MIRTQVQLTQEQFAALKREAVDRGISMAEVIRRALEQELERGKRREARQRMIASIGGFRSGLRDVARRHDDYLGEDANGW